MVTYFQPMVLEEALDIRARREVTVLAGATDVYPARTARAGWGDMLHRDVLDISHLAELRGIAREDAHWRIGALATWTDIIRADLPPLFDGLKAAAREIGGVQIQNRGTLAGNLCTASPAGDGIPNLLSLDAKIQLRRSGGMRTLPIAEFQAGYRATALAADEIVTAIIVPDRVGFGCFLKLGARRYLVISIAMAAGVIELDAAGRIAHAAIAVGACSAVARRLPALERVMVGKMPDAALVLSDHVRELEPIDDVRASADYRRAAALQLVRDLIAGFASSGQRAS